LSGTLEIPTSTATEASIVVGTVVMIFVAGAVWSVNPVTEARRKGAIGEEFVGSRLDKLAKQGFVVLHDRAIPGSRANIDHLVIGPTGVFVVDPKNYSGRITLSRGMLWTGRTPLTNTLSTLAWEAEQADKAIAPGVGFSVLVDPVVAVVGTQLSRKEFHLNGVLVVAFRDSARTLTKRPRFLSHESVERIAEVAIRALPAHLK
jgi:hypothetical protein